MLIDRHNFERWGSLATSKSEMAELVTQLVMNTLPNDGSRYNIPMGSSTFYRGWDGYVESAGAHHFIPEGKSGWEFGAVVDVPGKANSDYDTRTKGVSDEEKKETTFVFVTPSFWGKKDEWIAEKKKDNKWKDIRVYDSDCLSQWIYQLPVATEWFANKIGLFTNTGIVLPQRRWNEIAVGPKGIVLRPRFYTAGRERIIEEVQNMVEGKPGLKAFKASSREEALAFILAAGQTLAEPAQSKFMGKCVVVDSKDSLRQMASKMNAINIVTHLEDNSTVYQAATNNVVLVALGPDDDFRQDVVLLSVSERYALVEELVSYGIPEPEANKIVFTNNCNLTLIRKELGFPSAGAKWVEKEILNELQPALLLSRWNENFESDTFLLCSYQGVDYKKYHASLDQWLKQPVSPLTKTGPIWRLTSPLMLWTEMSNQLDNNFFDGIKNAFECVFVEAKEKYSDQLKEGLLQTLIIIALYGDRLGLPIGNAQEWVDAILKRLLHGATPDKWVEVSDHLPLIAEASPRVFLEEIEFAINKQTPVITALFEEKNGFAFPQSHHTSLLWALEALAWHPSYLDRVTRILLRLTEMDPGGRLSNRPFNSLVDIYLPWKPHTSVELLGRLAILDKCLSDGYPEMWDLMLSMLPKPGAVTSGTYKLKWRDYEFGEELGYSPTAIYDAEKWAVTRLISAFSGEDKNLASLIEKMEPVDRPLRRKLILWLPEAVRLIKGPNKETRKALRETLWYQNLTGIKERYALTKEETASVRVAYEATIPVNLTEKYIWLFDEYYPHIPEKPDGDEEDIYVNARQTERLRKEACAELIDKLGIDEVVALKDAVKEPQTLGATLATFSIDGLTAKVCRLLGAEKDAKFVKGYIVSMESSQGEGFFSSLYDACKKDGFTKAELTSLLLCFEQNRKLWDFIETLDADIQQMYWERVPAVFWGGYKEENTLYKISKLASVGRGLDAMNDSWIYAKEMPTAVIEELLQSVLRSKKELNDTIDHHPLSVYIEQLHKREDADKELLLQLEWMFLPVLRYDHKEDSLVLLNERLASSPEFVVELLCYLYKAETEEDQEQEPTEADRHNAMRALYLFNQWRTIPGAGDEGTLDEKILSEWMSAVLSKASECGQYKHACSQLGQLFAHFPEWENDAEKLFAVIEPIEEKAFYSSYNAGLFNKRGFTSRGPYDGGGIERGNAELFKGLYEKYNKKYPRVSKVFKDLWAQYERMAKEMDDEADITKLDY